MDSISKTLCTSLAGLALTGCMAIEADDATLEGDALDEEEISSAEQGLYGNTNFFWPNAGTGRVDIDVCWVNPNNAPGASGAERAAWRDARRRTVEESWGRHARINFMNWDGASPVTSPTSCSASQPGIHVIICNSPTDSRCPALPASQAVATSFGYEMRLNRNHGASIAVHEMGHALGFYHAEERPDAPPITSGPCAKQSFPNDAPVSYGAYDQDSAMSYCSPPTGAPWLSPNDVTAIQRSYGRRIPGSLVTTRGNCAAANHADGEGDPAGIWDCDEAFRDQEFMDEAGDSDLGWELVQRDANNSFPLCLGPTSASSGAGVTIDDCVPNREWRFQEMQVRAFGLCLDLHAGDTTPGNRIQMWECGALGGVNQQWTRHKSGLLEYRTSGSCARVGADGRLAIAACNASDGAQKFGFASGGKIRRFDNQQCLDVLGPTDPQYVGGLGLPTNGAAVQQHACNSSMNQKWSFNGAIRLDIAPTLCLRRGGDGNGFQLFLGQCTGDESSWDYYF